MLWRTAFLIGRREGDSAARSGAATLEAVRKVRRVTGRFYSTRKARLEIGRRLEICPTRWYDSCSVGGRERTSVQNEPKPPAPDPNPHDPYPDPPSPTPPLPDPEEIGRAS